MQREQMAHLARTVVLLCISDVNNTMIISYESKQMGQPWMEDELD